MTLNALEDHDSYYDRDGSPLKFCSKRKTINYDGMKIVLNSLPYLINEKSGHIYFSIPAVKIIRDYIKEAKNQGEKEVTINQLARFNRGKLPIGKRTQFNYSPAEHFFIPGLVRDIPSDGYLTPVYFEGHVLLKFEHADGYRLEKHTASFGYIHGPNIINIPYGVNKDGFVIMWLGDIVRFPNNELLYLYSANVKPQYDLHSDFYRNQILGEGL